jgi:tetratricopeptide (TPR) repeat protein
VTAGRDVTILTQEAPKVSRAWIFATLLALLVLGGIVGGAAYWWLAPMQGGYNLAVAEFTFVESDGQTVSNEESREVSRWFYQVIEEEARRLPSILRPETRGPDRIRSIRVTDADRRESAAAQLAKRLKATILIYGQIQRRDDGGYLVQPEFLVSSEGYLYVSEATGPNRLGSPIPVEAPLQSSALELNAELNARVQVLQRMVSGLGSYYLGNYDEAAAKFQEATDIPYWEPGEGKEVAYYLLGQARLRGYDQLVGNTEQLSQSYNAFLEAYRLNPEYARACLGLGAVALQQSGIQDALRTGIIDVKPDKLEEALYWYRVSTDKRDQPPLANIPVKADYGLGQVHLLGSLGQIPGYSGEEARGYFERVIAAYQATPNFDLAWYAAHSHALLGWLAYWIDGDWNSLDSQSRQAIAMLERLPANKISLSSIARYWSWVAIAQVNLDDLEKARQAYDQAILIGTNTVNPSEVAAWRQQQESLK